MRNNKKGFTLIELMIVVAIIAIISAIAIPSLMKTRMQTNETAAIGSLKTLGTAQVAYHRDFNVFATSYENLFGYDDTVATAYQSHAALNDEALRAARITDGTTGPAELLAADATAKSGYFFFSNCTYSGDNFMMGATPSSFDSSGRRTYFSNPGATIFQVEVDATPDANAATYQAADAWDPTGGSWETAK